ncbi:hypothetical protein P3T76_001154 [Phytophthora citrophthora]|uniref:SH2 domain-containing protein n=1 Tax=Phytophthora citrophthora TaxID=4793 RepID=A0AAD9GXZ1_9STRA|nr:hypothetical protein P3T76_001154 [Phytophthora citrophthora]
MVFSILEWHNELHSHAPELTICVRTVDLIDHMTREPWLQHAEERGSFKRIPGGDQGLSIASGTFPVRTGSKVEIQGSGRSIQQEPQSGASEMNSKSQRRGSMLGSLKAYYRKLRTFKGTVRALIQLRRTPLSLLNAVNVVTPAASSVNELRSAVLEMPRISATAASTVQTQVHKLVAEGHVVAEIDPTTGKEVTYRQQGNLDHYTVDNLAKRVSLQQHPHMIALTQRLWNCAVRNGEKKLKFDDYETYMLCLHRLILPEFDVGASKGLIMDDWKRDSGEQDHLDYAFFHLSMFELVDLWTDTVDPEDYISLLYCITHCLTYLRDDSHKLKSLEGQSFVLLRFQDNPDLMFRIVEISTVDILEESKGVTLESIKKDLERELNSDEFSFYQDQVKVATEERRIAEQKQNEPTSPRRKSQSQQINFQSSQNSQNSPRSRSRERKRSTPRGSERAGNAIVDSFASLDSDSTPQHRRSRSGSGAFGQVSPRRKFSVQASTNALNLTADTSGLNGLNAGSAPYAQNHPIAVSPRRETELKAMPPRRETGIQRAVSPNVFSRGGGVILSVGLMDGMVMSKPIADGKSALAVSTSGMAAFPRRRSRSASNSSQHQRDQIMQAIDGKIDSNRDAAVTTGLQVNHIEASGSALRTGTQDPNALGYILLPGSNGSGKPQGPFTVRAAAVAEAAANMAIPAVPPNSRQTLSVQRTQRQLQRTNPLGTDGTALSGGATKNIPPNFFINNSSLTAPLMTIVSSKAQTPRESTSVVNNIQLQFQETPTRPQTPHGASISSPRASNAITAQAAGIFISSQQRPAKPPSSPRTTLLQRPGSSLSSEYQPPINPRKLHQYQQDEGLSLVATGPGSTSMSLAISGRPAADTVQRRSSRFDSAGRLVGEMGLSFGTSDGVTTTSSSSQPKGDLKTILSPRYVVAEPVVPHHPAQLSNLKQTQGSIRGFAGAKSSRRQPSSLANGPATSHLQQHRIHIVQHRICVGEPSREGFHDEHGFVGGQWNGHQNQLREIFAKQRDRRREIEKALQDASYAKTLFRRWKRHGVESRAAYDKLTKFDIGYDKKIFALYKNYVAWLTKHHPLGVWETGASSNLFSKTKLSKAMADSKYASTMFGRWKRHGFESDAVYTKLLAFNLASDQNVYKTYTNYVSWLDLHHRLARTRKVASRNFLFNADELVRAKTDTSLARSIFSKWKTNGLDSRPVFLKLLEMGLKPNGDDGLFRLYVNYVNWLNVHYHKMGPENEASALLWWDEELAQPSVSYRNAFFPTLLQACDPQSLPSELSRDELRVLTQFCVSPDAHQKDQVTKEDVGSNLMQVIVLYAANCALFCLQLLQFRRFIARFGPLESSLAKLVACFCANRELVPWFHGEIGRKEAEQVLAAKERSDGAFLVRFSESHPTKFTLTYLKVHSASSNTPGRRELKNCLVRNLGVSGYALTEAVRRGGGADTSVRQRTYPSIGAFIQSSSNRLKYGIASEFSAKCNQELAAVRAIQDQQSDSYAAFSTESFGNPEPPPNASAMLFSRSPPSSSFLSVVALKSNTTSTSGAISDNYGGFALDSLAPPTVHRLGTPGEVKRPSSGKWGDEKVMPPPEPFASSDYSSFATFAHLQPEGEAQPTAAAQAGNCSGNSSLHHLHSAPAGPVYDESAFGTLMSKHALESQKVAGQGHQATSFSRSPAFTIQPGFANSGAYESFASVAVTKPTIADSVDSTLKSGGPSREQGDTSDYGNFSSLASELEEKKPHWEQTLGPPPPLDVKSGFNSNKSATTDDIYGNFTSLSITENGAPTTKSLPTSAPNSDAYGTFDPMAAAPMVETTPITSALDELNVGMEFYKQKRLDDALLRFMLAQEMARASGDQVVEARALGNLGTVHLDKKNPHQAVRCYQQCLDITRAIEDTKRERTILNNLVLALVASDDFERALACCQVQLETTTNAINRRKIISRMSLLREKMTRQATS